ncbi:MAG: hypothetical protein J6D37_04560 [Clostridia bacterium]|nr:hypothetical protein [Clostridia bacterium]
MKKTTKTMATVMGMALVGTLALGMTGCDRRVSATAKKTYSEEYVSQNMSKFEGGASMFLTMAKAYSENTLTLKEDGTYEYVKDLQGPALSLSLVVTYTGTYKNGTTEYNGSTDNSYILTKPTEANFVFVPGMTCMAGWGDGVVHGVDTMMEAGKKEYTGGLEDKLWIGAPADEYTPVEFFLGETLLMNPTEGLTEEEIFVEVALDGDTIVYLNANSTVG